MSTKLDLKDYKTKADMLFKDFDEFQSLIKEGDNIDVKFLERRILKIFYGIDLKTMRKLSLHQIELLIAKINLVLTQPESKRLNIIQMDGIQYGFIPNFDDCTAGELIDMDDCLDNKDFISLTSIVYRPIIGNVNKKGEYKIAEYDGYNKLFERVNLEVVEGYMSFFWSSFHQLNQLMNSSMEEEKMTIGEMMVV